MRKKVLVVLTFMMMLMSGLLTACGRAASNAGPAINDSGSIITEAVQRTYEPFTMIQPHEATNYGNGNSKGFYDIFENEDSSKNVLFVDYGTKEQVYLCAQPNCAHDSEACTSWIAPTTDNVSVAATEDTLFWIFSGRYNNSHIDKSDIDGSNRSTIYTFPSNVELATGIAYNKNHLAFCITSYLEDDEGATTRQQALCVLDISSGNCDTIFSTDADQRAVYEQGASSMFFFGVTDTDFVVKTITAGSVETIDEDGNIVQDFLPRHVLYGIPFDGSDIKTLLEYDESQCYEEPSGPYLYYLKNHDEGHYGLERVNTATLETSTVIEDFTEIDQETVIPDCAFSDLSIDAFVDHYVIVKAMGSINLKDNGDIELIFKNYAVDTMNGDVIPLTLSTYYNATELPLPIMAQLPEYLLVIARIEESYPNGESSPVNREKHLALIRKQDYFDSNPVYDEISAIRYRG